MVEVRAEYEYIGKEDDELSMRPGDIITDVDKMEGGWWQGTLNGKTGMFPDNFVKEIPKKEKPKPSAGPSPHKKNSVSSNVAELASKLGDIRLGGPTPGPAKRTSVAPPSGTNTAPKRLAKVTFAYNPQQEDELKLELGTIVEITKQEEEGWWEGIVNSKTGVFPSNFVELIEDSPSDDASSKDSNKDSNISEGDVHEIKGRQIQGIGLGNIFKDGPIKLKKHGSKDVVDEKAAPEAKAQPLNKKTPSEPPVVPPKEPKETKPSSEGNDLFSEVGSGYCKNVMFFNMTGDLMMIYDPECSDIQPEYILDSCSVDEDFNTEKMHLTFSNDTATSAQQREADEVKVPLSSESTHSVHFCDFSKVWNDSSDVPLDLSQLSRTKATPPPKRRSILRKRKSKGTPIDSPSLPTLPPDCRNSFGDSLYQKMEYEANNMSDTGVDDPNLKRFISVKPQLLHCDVKHSLDNLGSPYNIGHGDTPIIDAFSPKMHFSTEKITDSVKLTKHRFSSSPKRAGQHHLEDNTVAMVFSPISDQNLAKPQSRLFPPKAVESSPGPSTPKEDLNLEVIGKAMRLNTPSASHDSEVPTESTPKPQKARSQSLSRRLSSLNPKYLFRKMSLRRLEKRKSSDLTESPVVMPEPENYLEYLQKTNRMSPMVHRIVKRYNIYSEGRMDGIYSWYFKTHLTRNRDGDSSLDSSNNEFVDQPPQSSHQISEPAKEEASLTSERSSLNKRKIPRKGSIFKRLSLRRKTTGSRSGNIEASTSTRSQSEGYGSDEIQEVPTEKPKRRRSSLSRIFSLKRKPSRAVKSMVDTTAITSTNEEQPERPPLEDETEVGGNVNAGFTDVSIDVSAQTEPIQDEICEEETSDQEVIEQPQEDEELVNMEPEEVEVNGTDVQTIATSLPAVKAKKPKRKRSSLMRLFSLKRKSKRKSQAEIPPTELSNLGEQESSAIDVEEENIYNLVPRDEYQNQDSAPEIAVEVPEEPDQIPETTDDRGSYPIDLPKNTPFEDYDQIFRDIMQNILGDEFYTSVQQPSYSEESSKRESLAATGGAVGGVNYDPLPDVAERLAEQAWNAEVRAQENRDDQDDLAEFVQDFGLSRNDLEYPGGVADEVFNVEDNSSEALCPRDLFTMEHNNFYNFFRQDSGGQTPTEESTPSNAKLYSPSRSLQQNANDDDNTFSETTTGHTPQYRYPWHSARETPPTIDSLTAGSPPAETDQLPDEVYRIYKTHSFDIPREDEDRTPEALNNTACSLDRQHPQRREASLFSEIVGRANPWVRSDAPYVDDSGPQELDTSVPGADESLNLQEISFNLLDDMSRLLPGLSSETNSILIDDEGEEGFDEVDPASEDPLGGRRSPTPPEEIVIPAEDDESPTAGSDSNTSSPDVAAVLAAQNAQDYYMLTLADLSPATSPNNPTNTHTDGPRFV